MPNPLSRLFHSSKSTSNNPTTPAKMPTATATLPGTSTVIAQSDTYETVEGNIYFPPSSIVDKSILGSSSTHSTCPWKGEASYYTLNVDGQQLRDAAWYYPQPKSKAENIKDYVAFYKTKVNVSVA